MIWTQCPRCQGESGDFCGGNCHEGGLYICEHCGNAEVENWEECPCCGCVDEDMRLARLKTEADEGNIEAAAELYALESGEHDKAAIRQAFIEGVAFVGQPSVNAELLEALKALVEDVANQYWGRKEPTQIAYKNAVAIIAKAKGGAA